MSKKVKATGVQDVQQLPYSIEWAYEYEKIFRKSLADKLITVEAMKSRVNELRNDLKVSRSDKSLMDVHSKIEAYNRIIKLP